MSTSLGLLTPFDPIDAEWPRRPEVHRATAAAEEYGAVGYRGGPLPGLPDDVDEPALAGARWHESLLRWLAEMPREFPPQD